MEPQIIESAAQVISHGESSLSIISLIMGADIIVKIVLLILFSASVWSWKVFIEKIIIFNNIDQKTKKFEKVFWSGQVLDQLFERIKARPNHPMASLFVAAVYEWHKYSAKDFSHNQSLITLGIKERLYQAMELSKSKEIGYLEKNVNFLATVGSSAPFIGLFGTVWGIMNSFQSIAAAKNATLAVVAPGIAEALFATAVGLVAAIPAVIFYNILSSRLNKFSTKLDEFSNELGSILTRELDKA
jgi:biopolymer transport protein TolQ